MCPCTKSLHYGEAVCATQLNPGIAAAAVWKCGIFEHRRTLLVESNVIVIYYLPHHTGQGRLTQEERAKTTSGMVSPFTGIVEHKPKRIKLIEQFVFDWHTVVRLRTVSEALCIVCPLWIDALVEVHQNSVLRLELTVKYALHVAVSTWFHASSQIVIQTSRIATHSHFVSSCVILTNYRLCTLIHCYDCIHQHYYFPTPFPHVWTLGVVRIVLLRFLVGCRTRRLNHALSVLSLLA